MAGLQVGGFDPSRDRRGRRAQKLQRRHPSRREQFAGSDPRDGCDSGTPIAPQNRRFWGGSLPALRAAQYRAARSCRLTRSVQRRRGAALLRSGRRDVIRGVTGGHRSNHTLAWRIERALGDVRIRSNDTRLAMYPRRLRPPALSAAALVFGAGSSITVPGRETGREPPRSGPAGPIWTSVLRVGVKAGSPPQRGGAPGMPGSTCARCWPGDGACGRKSHCNRHRVESPVVAGGDRHGLG